MRKGKRWTALLLALVLCLSVLPAGVLASETGAAEAVSPSVMAVTSGKCGKNLTWKLDGKGTLTISGKGKMYDYRDGAPWSANLQKIKSVVIQKGVTNIGLCAFSNCSNLTKVTIPSSVTNIGVCAFEFTGLTKLVIPNGVNNISESAFTECYKLTSVTIPNSVTNIGDFAFGWCSSLTSVTIPNSIKRINTGVFSSCSELTRITIPTSVKSIGDEAFFKCGRLKNVYYAGSKSQWKKISIGEYNGYFPYATVHYNTKVGKKKASQPIKVSPTKKTYKASALKKTAKRFNVKVTKAKGKVSYKSSSKSVVVNNKGKVNVSKGIKKGTYKVTVTAAETSAYAKATKTIVIHIT